MSHELNSMLVNSLLGKDADFDTSYNPDILFKVPRQIQRDNLNIGKPLPFYGEDIWNVYELSWLNKKGKPQYATAEIYVPITSENIFESKSLKLYFNSMNQTKFESTQELIDIITKDLSDVTGSEVLFRINLNNSWPDNPNVPIPGSCLDAIDVEVNNYEVDRGLLQLENTQAKETVYSHLLKTNCPITGQPDWSTAIISYEGTKINHSSLLKYLISYRLHQDFHEHCAESIYMDIMQECKPSKLSVYLRYTRRGGIDINPFRSSEKIHPENHRLWRQ